MKSLDVSQLPFEQTYACADGTAIDMLSFLIEMMPILDAMGAAGVITENDSFGFAMAEPILDWCYPGRLLENIWDDPYTYTWFVGGWGDERDHYIANAVRKLRPLLREGEISTLEMRFGPQHGYFMDTVESRGWSGNYPWGDFPRGGAVSVQHGPLTMFAACSGFSEIEDDITTRLILGEFAKRITLANELLPT